MNKHTYQWEFSILAIAAIVAIVMWMSATHMESNVIKSCDENGVYLTQKGLLVCEWRTPQKIK